LTGTVAGRPGARTHPACSGAMRIGNRPSKRDGPRVDESAPGLPGRSYDAPRRRNIPRFSWRRPSRNKNSKPWTMSALLAEPCNLHFSPFPSAYRTGLASAGGCPTSPPAAFPRFQNRVSPPDPAASRQRDSSDRDPCRKPEPSKPFQGSLTGPRRAGRNSRHAHAWPL